MKVSGRGLYYISRNNFNYYDRNCRLFYYVTAEEVTIMDAIFSLKALKTCNQFLMSSWLQHVHSLLTMLTMLWLFHTTDVCIVCLFVCFSALLLA